jgi:hypothetical protein
MYIYMNASNLKLIEILIQARYHLKQKKNHNGQNISCKKESKA